jgi:CBS domain containing-hemolysin-like protein
MEVADFATAFGFSLPEGDYETLGGFLSSLAGSLPEAGDRFSFNGWQFTVQTKEGPRLGRVRLIRPKGSVVGAVKESAVKETLRTGT